MKKLLIAILMLASVLGVSAQGFKISAYPNKAVPADTDLFLLATPNVANWNITSAQLRQYVTNGIVIPVYTGNATNFWGVLSPTNLPPGLSTSNYVGIFFGNGAGLTNISVTNLIGLINVTNLPPGVLTNNYTLPVVFSNSVTTGDLTVNGTLTVNSTNNQTLVSNLTVYGWQTNFGLISSTNFVGLFYGDGSGLTNLQGTALDPNVLTNNRTLVTTLSNDTRIVGNFIVVGGKLYGDGYYLTNLLEGSLFEQSQKVTIGGAGAEYSLILGDTPSLLFTNQVDSGRFAVSSVGGISWNGVASGNGAGITNLPVGGIAATGIGATKFLKGDGTWDIPAMGAATNVIWPIAGTNTVLVTNSLTVQINVPFFQSTNLLNGGSTAGQLLTATSTGVGWSNAPSASVQGTNVLSGGSTPGQILTATAGGSAWSNAPSVSGMLTNGSTNVTFNGLTVNTYLTINATNATTTVSNLLVTGWQTNYGALSSTNFAGVFYGNGAGLTNAPYLPLVGGTVSGAVLSTSSTTNAPSQTELATAGWVRGLFNNGVLYYSTTNAATGFTNSDYPNIYAFSTNIPASGARGYTNTALTAGNYIGTVVTTNTFQQVIGPIHVDSYVGLVSAGNPSVSIHPEIYYSYDKTNWYGDYVAGDQALTLGTTNLKQFVVSFPTILSTNANGFYLARRWKVGSSSGLGATTVVWTLQGTNAISGTTSASHIAIDSPSSGGGDAFLANNQVFTGTNTFSTWLAGNGGGLTNLTVSVVTGATLTNQVYASNVVSGGILPVGTVATNNPWAGAFLTGVASTRFWTQDGSTLTNITAAQTPWGSDINGNQKNLTNVASIVVAGPGTNWLDVTYITNGTRTFLHDGTHTVITNTASLTSSEWTAGSQKEWYNGTATMTIDKTNGTITANSFIGKQIIPTKAAFTTNYTILSTDAVLFCTGTNQLLTLPLAPSTGQMFTIVSATTTGSCVVTNANGSQTILGALSISVPATNRITVVFDGSAYW